MILQTKNLTKTYCRKEKEFEAVYNVDFSLSSGEMAILTGPSGCGKSTFFRLICGITKATSGEIWFKGENLCTLTDQQLVKYRANNISYILQGESLIHNFTVMENICLPHQLNDASKEIEQRALSLLQEFGLENMAQEYPSNLSGGERRRVAIARAFVHDPDLVVADEPTSDLDEENTTIILDYFQKQQKQGRSIIISTHDLSCLRWGTVHYTMNKGVMTQA